MCYTRVAQHRHAGRDLLLLERPAQGRVALASTVEPYANAEDCQGARPSGRGRLVRKLCLAQVHQVRGSGGRITAMAEVVSCMNNLIT